MLNNISYFQSLATMGGGKNYIDTAVPKSPFIEKKKKEFGPFQKNCYFTFSKDCTLQISSVCVL